MKTLKVSSFLLPMSSSGNIVFKNEAVLRSVLNESPLMEKISSIDSFTEGALKYAQLFKQESFYYFAACALCLVSMGAAGIMSAQLWMYVLLNFVGYIFFSKREFLQMSFRRE